MRTFKTLAALAALALAACTDNSPPPSSQPPVSVFVDCHTDVDTGEVLLVRSDASTGQVLSSRPLEPGEMCP